MRKNVFILAVALIMLVACRSEETVNYERKKNVTFSVKGDFEIEEPSPYTRALTSEGKEMTDLWIIDADEEGNILQAIHQVNTESAFGAPSLSMKYGDHKLYFCASRGTEPTLNGWMVRWVKVLDTFWTSKTFTVDEETAASQSVELERVATRLKVTVEDGVPSGVTSFEIGMKQVKEIDLRTGVGTLEDGKVAFPMTLEDEGNTGIEYGVFSLCPSREEWKSVVTLKYNTKETKTVTEVPFKMNRETRIKGFMNSKEERFSITLKTDWETGIDQQF